MILENIAAGFVFLAVVTGVGTFVFFIMSCFAVADDKDYAGFVVAITIILALIFLVSGFMGFSGVSVR